MWKFTSDSSVNGWGWRFTVYPVMPTLGPHDLLSDRTILSRPSMNIVMCLLENNLEIQTNEKGTNLAVRLVAALAACAQVSSLGANQRMWALQKLRKLIRTLPHTLGSDSITNTNDALEVLSKSLTGRSSIPLGASLTFSGNSSVLEFSPNVHCLPTPAILIPKGLRGLPDLLLKQYDYEEPIVRSGKHLMYSPFFKVFKSIINNLILILLFEVRKLIYVNYSRY